MRRWLADTLFKRLFALMWLALVGSHVAAFAVVATLHWPLENLRASFLDARLPTFPSLPPTPGVPDSRHLSLPGRPGTSGTPGTPGTPGTQGALDRSGAPDKPAMPGEPHPPGSPGPSGLPGPHGPPGPPNLPTDLLVLDYGVRLVIIAAAAWLGARWVAAPMKRLATASRSLGQALGRRDRALPRLDETRGSVEVRGAAHVFNEMAGELDEQFRARGLLMAAISHDLRTPLTRMRMRLEKLAHDPAAQRCIADIHEMDGLIESVFELFRGTDAGEPLRQVDVFALVQSLADDLAETGGSVAVDGEPVVVKAQPAALRRVVSNLLDNALRYGERAQVTIEAHAHAARILIDDAGPGIPDAQLEAVFQPFVRIESSRNRGTGGTGLGLYIARDLLVRQGGRLSLSNRPGGGLRAEIVLQC